MRDDLEKEAHKNPKLDWINTADRKEELLNLAKRCVEVLSKQELRREKEGQRPLLLTD